MIFTLRRYNIPIALIKATFLSKYILLPWGTDIIVGSVKACRERKREMILCAVAIEKWKMHEIALTLIQSECWRII
jgi:hypothetical protein